MIEAVLHFFGKGVQCKLKVLIRQTHWFLNDGCSTFQTGIAAI